MFCIARDRGLEMFDNLKALRDTGMFEFVTRGQKCETVCFVRLIQLPIPGSLWIAADQEQKHISACCCFADVLHLAIEFVYDFAHRSNNDIMDALVKSGLWTVYLMSIVIFNISFGPYSSCAWFHSLGQSAQNFAARLTPDDPLVLRYWPRIVLERGLSFETADDKVGYKARSDFVKGLDSSVVVSKKGQRTSKKQWWSFQRTFRAWKSTLSERALLYSGAGSILLYIHNASLATNDPIICLVFRMSCSSEIACPSNL